MKRFTIPTSAFFYPPTPGINPYDDCSVKQPKTFSSKPYNCKMCVTVSGLFKGIRESSVLASSGSGLEMRRLSWSRMWLLRATLEKDLQLINNIHLLHAGLLWSSILRRLLDWGITPCSLSEIIEFPPESDERFDEIDRFRFFSELLVFLKLPLFCELLPSELLLSSPLEVFTSM